MSQMVFSVLKSPEQKDFSKEKRTKRVELDLSKEKRTKRVELDLSKEKDGW
jgi:hypothetical protein